MKRLFGTDGVRGVVGEGLDANLAFALGVSAAEVLSHGEEPLTVLVGEDTRESSPMLAAALAAGLAAGGAVVRMLGVLPTPAVSYLTTLYRADVGAVVSASHNPHEYNGIKLFGADGEKLSDLYEEAIEAALSHTSEHAARCGRVSPEAGAREAYLAHLAAIAPPPPPALSPIRSSWQDAAALSKERWTAIAFFWCKRPRSFPPTFTAPPFRWSARITPTIIS